MFLMSKPQHPCPILMLGPESNKQNTEDLLRAKALMKSAKAYISTEGFIYIHQQEWDLFILDVYKSCKAADQNHEQTFQETMAVYYNLLHNRFYPSEIQFGQEKLTAGGLMRHIKQTYINLKETYESQKECLNNIAPNTKRSSHLVI